MQTVAVICRNTGWTRRPEPDDLENEGLWCQAVLGTATGCEVLRASKAAVDKWARATDSDARQDTSLSIGKRVLWPPAVFRWPARTLWICRCAWTTLVRRPQLHRAYIGAVDLSLEKNERAGPETNEAAVATFV